MSAHKNACSLCARRKVKCDKESPCSNCHKAQAQCVYEAPQPSRPRKRAADEDSLARLAAYEALMKKHHIDFSSCAQTWIHSGLEQSAKPLPSPSSVADVALETNARAPPSVNTLHHTYQCLWSNLSPELKSPSIQSLRHGGDPYLQPEVSLQRILETSQPSLHELHPEPRHIHKLWQIFVDAANPLLKIIHVPTLQQRIFDGSWEVHKIEKPLTALMFATYTLAILSLSPEDCQHLFHETKDNLYSRYRSATLKALIAADFLVTSHLEVLQAFTLFLFANPDSDLTSTLIAAAIKLGERMGLNQDETYSSVPFFEQEMRLRLWWQLCGLDARTRATKLPSLRIGNLRLPLNVNDADLHPAMINPPIEHRGPTEMICVLIKFEVTNWLRSSSTGVKLVESITEGHTKGPTALHLEDMAISELESIYYEKFLRKCDNRIPLHRMAKTMADLAIARMHFKIHHPRNFVHTSDGKGSISERENDKLFDSAVRILERIHMGIESDFTSHLFTHFTCAYPLDAYIYVISELRRRFSGTKVDSAWQLVQTLYEEQPELVQEAGNCCFTALGDLTLEAWEARSRELLSISPSLQPSTTPQFISLLRDKRSKVNESIGLAPLSNSNWLDSVGTTDGANLDWDYWNDFLRL